MGAHIFFVKCTSIAVATRDGKIYNIKDREALGLPIKIQSEVVGMIRASKNIMLGRRNCTVHCYHVKGRKRLYVHFPYTSRPWSTSSPCRTRPYKARATWSPWRTAS